MLSEKKRAIENICYEEWKRFSWKVYLLGEPPTPWMVVYLIFTTFHTGWIDGLIVLEFGTYVYNQTGNILIVGSTITNPTDTTWRSLAALTSFIGTLLTFGQAINLITPNHRSARLWLFISGIYQILTFTLLTILYKKWEEMPTWLFIGTLASASGAQWVVAKNSGIRQINTGVATNTMVRLFTDPILFTPTVCTKKTEARDRGVSFLITLFLGSLSSGILYRATNAFVVLVISCFIKLVTFLYTVVIPTEIHCDEEEEKESPTKK